MKLLKSIVLLILCSPFSLAASQPADGTRNMNFIGTTGPDTPIAGFFFKENFSRGSDVVMQGEKIIVAGYINDAPGVPVVLRLNPDGSIDTTFGSDGIVTISSYITIGSSFSFGLAMAPDNGILFGNSLDVGNTGTKRLAVVKLTPDGALDTTFNASGSGSSQYGGNIQGLWYITGTEIFTGTGEACSLKVQSDGKIVIGGSIFTDTGIRSFTIVRINADGTLDTTFNSLSATPGIWYNNDASPEAQTAYFSENTYIYGTRGVSIQQDGSIVGGGVLRNSGLDRAGFVRLTSDGVIDDTFNTSGTSTMGGTIPGYYVLLVPDGSDLSWGALRSACVDPLDNILGGGYIFYDGQPVCGLTMRLTPDGTLDTTYNASGSRTAFGGDIPGFWIIPRSQSIASDNSTSEAIEIDPAGRIVFTGQAGGEGFQRVIAVRLIPDGTLDTTFNPNPPGSGNPYGGNTAGFYMAPTQYTGTPLTQGIAIPSSLTVNRAGQVLVAYTACGPGLNYLTCASIIEKSGLFQDTASPFSTSTDGVIVTTTIDQSERLIVGGNFGTDAQITRYNLTGSPRDTTFNTDGVALGDLVQTANINKIINTDSGEYLIAGVSNTNQFTTALYTDAGSLSTDYGNGTGIVTEPDLTAGIAYDLIISGTGLIAVSGYTTDTDATVINYGITGIRNSAIGINGLQIFAQYSPGVVYSIKNKDDDKYLAGQYNNTAFFKGSVNLTGVLQDITAPFDTSLPGLIITTTIDQSEKLVVAGNYGDQSQITRYNLTGSPRDSSFGPDNGVALGDLANTATINKVINKDDGYLVAGVSNTDQFTSALYTDAGALNTGYGSGGIVSESTVGISAAYDMLLKCNLCRWTRKK